MTLKASELSMLNRRNLLLGMAGLAAATCAPGLASAREAEGGGATITNFNRPKSVASTVTEIKVDADKAWPMLEPSGSLRLLEAIGRYEIIASNGGWPELSVPRVMMRGGKGEQVVELRKRLAIEDYLPLSETKEVRFDKGLEAAVVRYQRTHGLQPHGRVDGPTVAELNVTVFQRLHQMRANLQRMDLYTQELYGRYIIVNIPATQLEAVNAEGKVVSRHNIIAGKPERPSPVVMAKLADVNFNPYWNAPVSIVERDLIPSILKEKDTLKRMNIRVFDGYGGPEVDASTIDWSKTRADRYFFRQEPGGDNAMATVKINFPSPFGVYMHDTPTRQFFNEAERYLSSGCVRVDQVHVLVNWILDGQDGWNLDRITDVAKKVERVDVKLTTPPDLRWVYLTAWVTGDGQVNFRPDVYELDLSGFVAGQPTPVGELAEDGRRWRDKMPPAPVLGAQAELAPDDVPILPPAPPAETAAVPVNVVTPTPTTPVSSAATGSTN
jgi:murein L,D-transpeptidase YcbB/YkuD